MAEQLERLKASLFERYTIERELGSGGMATVYLAEDLKHHRRVAIKILRPELAASLGVERFVREIEIAANLTHPHTLPLFDSGSAEDRTALPPYRLPLLRHAVHQGRIAQRADRPQGKVRHHKEAIRLTDQVASALSHAHELGLVDR